MKQKNRKKTYLPLTIAAIAFGALTTALTPASAKTADTDPVLMTVNGRPVYKSEFEYLYNKNSGQQLDKQTIDDYLEMFVNYKLKVADALANGYDTTAAYNKELEQYRAELAAPYMTDKEAEQEVLDLAYQHYLNLVNVSHIMLSLDEQQGMGQAGVIQRADSIRNLILSGQLDWNKAAEEYSIDRGSNHNGGNMGWMIAGRYPTAFEDAAYATPKGQISEPINSGFGIHLIRVEDTMPNPGEVKARHILKLTARMAPEQAEKAKEKIDSIYNVLMSGADFAEVAMAESEDPGSAKRGGELDWFGRGTMVAPFDSAAFTLATGVISKPIQTAYGWHILEVTDRRPPKTFAEMEKQLKGILINSDRGLIPEQRYMDKIKKEYNTHLIEANLDAIRNRIAANPGGYDSLMVAQLRVSDMPVAQVNNIDIPLSDVMMHVAVTNSTDADNARALIASAARLAADNLTRQEARVHLADNNAEYRNLINEYSDGILLFDISQDKVWQKAANDNEGINAYFRAHRADYSFDEPRYKAVIVFTSNDSIEQVVRDYLNSLDPKSVDLRGLNKHLRDKFGKHVRAERVIAKKGENAITDYLAFGGPKPENKQLSWNNYFPYQGQIIEQPVEADDVRSRVITDYQSQLEKDWVKELRSRYPVKIDKKVLKTIKETADK